jgi:hypothetical protein
VGRATDQGAELRSQVIRHLRAALALAYKMESNGVVHLIEAAVDMTLNPDLIVPETYPKTRPPMRTPRV